MGKAASVSINKGCKLKGAQMQQVSDYVQANFGEAEAKRLDKIRQGGDNNQKGGTYENHYAVYRVCSIAANDPNGDLQRYVISSQDLAFVDDLSIKEPNLKTNYQAKNSATNAADWTADTSKRFEMQSAIDRDIYGYPDNKQILLVSCPEKARNNEKKVPEPMKGYAGAEHFPYCQTPSQLIQTYQPVKDVMEGVCAEASISTLDAAFKLVQAAWVGSNGKELSVHDLFTEAKRLSKPNIFKIGEAEASLPAWLEKLCTSFAGCAIRVESGNFKISYKGLDVRCDAQLLQEEPEDEILATIASPIDLIKWAMKAMEKGLS